MAFRDIMLNFTKSNDWDLGATLGSGDTEYAPDTITLPTDTQSWDDIGGGEDLYVAIHVVESIDSAGSPQIRFDVGLADDNAGTGFYRIGETKGFTKAELTVTAPDFTAGSEANVGVLQPAAANAILIPLRPLEIDLDGSTKGKFISLRAVETASVALSEGKVRAWLTIGKDTGVQGLKHFHRSGFTVE